MYAPKTLPAIVAKPAVMMAWSSDLVTCGKYGRTSSGDSVWGWRRVILGDCANLLNNTFSKTVFQGDLS
jgi:hypothetical protein